MKTDSQKIHLLALETSSFTSGVYISSQRDLLAQTTLNVKNIHSRRLSLSIEQLLSHCGLILSDLSGIILSAGPGSFTGLRIGYSLAKGLAQVLQIPLMEVPTLDIRAYQQRRSTLPVLSLIDARRQELFYAVYQWKGDTFTRTTDYQLVPLTALTEIIREKVLLVSGEPESFLNQVAEKLGDRVEIPLPYSRQIEGWALLALGYDKYICEEFSQLDSCEPLYLRAFKGVM